jgi:hypothetical protein
MKKSRIWDSSAGDKYTGTVGGVATCPLSATPPVGFRALAINLSFGLGFDADPDVDVGGSSSGGLVLVAGSDGPGERIPGAGKVLLFSTFEFRSCGLRSVIVFLVF